MLRFKAMVSKTLEVTGGWTENCGSNTNLFYLSIFSLQPLVFGGVNYFVPLFTRGFCSLGGYSKQNCAPRLA